MNKNNIAIIILGSFLGLFNSSHAMSWFKRRTTAETMQDVRQRPWAYALRQKEALRKKDYLEREKAIQDKVAELKAKGKTDKEIDHYLLYNVHLQRTPESEHAFSKAIQSSKADFYSGQDMDKDIKSLEKVKQQKIKEFSSAFEKDLNTPEKKSWPYKPENYPQRSALATWWSNLWSSKPQTSKRFISSTPTTSPQQSSSNWFSRWWYGK